MTKPVATAMATFVSTDKFIIFPFNYGGNPRRPLFLDFTFYFSYIASNFRVLMDARRSARRSQGRIRRVADESKNFARYELHTRERRNCMKILTITAIIALPLMALGQTTDTQQTQTQEQTKDTQTTAPAKAKKMRPEQAEPGKPQAKPETGTNVRGQTNVKGRTQDMNTNQPGARSSTSTS